MVKVTDEVDFWNMPAGNIDELLSWHNPTKILGLLSKRFNRKGMEVFKTHENRLEVLKTLVANMKKAKSIYTDSELIPSKKEEQMYATLNLLSDQPDSEDLFGAIYIINPTKEGDRIKIYLQFYSRDEQDSYSIEIEPVGLDKELYSDCISNGVKVNKIK